MKHWRMSFRCGVGGFEMFEKCLSEKVAAITYHPLTYTDLRKHPYLEPSEKWKQLKPTQNASLKRFAYEIKVNDIIYVKQGPSIVGRGKVVGPYKFNKNTEIYCPKENEPWFHQMDVKWENDFIPFRLLLGSEQFTVIPLDKDQVSKIEMEQKNIINNENNMSALEGEKRKAEITFRKRNRALIEAKKSNSDGTCEICGFNYNDYYKGLKSKNYLVAHHINPIKMREGASKTTLDDIVLICSNCHTAVHSADPPISLKQMKKKIRYSHS